jgi:hypothetical protein
VIGTHDQIAGRKVADCAWKEEFSSDMLTPTIQHFPDESAGN